MKVLVVDRDALVGQLAKSRLEPRGHKVAHEAVKNNAVARMASEEFDVIFLDPAPISGTDTPPAWPDPVIAG